MRDVVDSVDIWLFGTGDRLRNPRREDPKLPGRLGEEEAELGHEVDGQARPQGRDRSPPTLEPEFGQVDPGLPTRAANVRLGVADPVRPGALGLLPGIPRRQHPLLEGPRAEDALIGEGNVLGDVVKNDNSTNQDSARPGR